MAQEWWSTDETVQPKQSVSVGVEIPNAPEKPEKPPSGYRFGPGGALEVIPGGPADPLAPQAAGTGEEGKNVGFYIRAIGANRLYENQGVGPRDILDKEFAEKFPNVANSFVSGDARQVADAAESAFVESILRSDSGAAVPDYEVQNGRTRFFPQPGDREAVIRAKKQLREQAIAGVIARAGTQAPKAFETWNQLLSTYETPEGGEQAAEDGGIAAPKIEVAQGAQFATDEDFRRRAESAEAWAATQGLPFDQALVQFNETMAAKGYGEAKPETIDVLRFYEDKKAKRNEVQWELPTTGVRESGAPGAAAAIGSGLVTGVSAGLGEEFVNLFDAEAAAKLEAAKQYGREEYPLTTLGSEIVGGVISPINKIIPGAPALAPAREAITQTAKQAALYGTLSGAGEAAPDAGLLERVPGAVIGGTLGGVTGAAAQKYVTPAVTSAVERFVAPVVSRLVTPTASQAIPAAEAASIPLITSDIVRPKTWFGKWTQETMEKVPFIGTGGARATQREAREAAITKLYDDFQGGTAEIDDITRDFLKVRGEQIGKLTREKGEVFDKVSGSPVDVSDTLAVIDSAITRFGTLKSYEPLVSKLQTFRDDLMSGNIADIELTRKIIGDALGDDTLKPVASELKKVVNDIYPALRQDMGRHIQQFGEAGDFAKWRSANTALSDFATDLENSTIKRVLKNGNATPEEAKLLLFSKKPSEVRALFASLSEEGKKNARALIVQDMVEKSGGIDTLSPAKFTTQLKQSAKKNGVAFEPTEVARLDGLLRALQFTRRADQAAVTTPTGQVLLPVLATSGAAYLEPTVGAFGLVLSTIMAGARVYETKAVKNLLVALSRTAPGSKAEQNVLGSLTRVMSQEAGRKGAEGGQAVTESMAPPEVPTQ